MNTIHSSSLTHYPVAYPKPQAVRIDDSHGSTTNNGSSTSSIQHSEFSTRPSSTALIQRALTEVGLKDNTSSLPNNSKMQKALNAYAQNYNQTAHQRVAEIISGIDLYA